MAVHSRLARRVLAGLTGLLAACLVSVGLASCGGTSATSGPPGFSATGSMAAARMSHTATRLPNGKVLIAGGYSGQGPNSLTYLASAELYDPATGTFSPTGSMSQARGGAAAALLSNGKVLVAGGYYVDASAATVALASAELYDPATGAFSPTGSMSTARYHHTATPLTSGIVVIAGGTGSSGSLASVELYDPGTAAFGSGGSMTAARVGHTATLLSNGRVLLAGGARADQPASPEYLASAELYDPAARTSAATGSMAAARYTPAAALLVNDKVLIVGGQAIGTGVNKVSLASAEVFDPATGQFKATGSMAAARTGPRSVLLSNGRVLVVGGLGLLASGAASYPTSAELYDPASGAFTAAGSTTGRAGATATLLADGRVLIAGGGATGGALASAELYQP